jgi:hypothetical protein
MNKVRVTPELQRDLRFAMQNPFRFERTERFAMREVLAAADDQSEVERVFLDTACDALQRQQEWQCSAPAADVERAA